MRGWVIAVVAGLLLSACGERQASLAPTAETKAASAAATLFYGDALALPPGLPDIAGQARLLPHITPKLKSALAAAAKAEDVHRAITNNEEPPLFQGNLYVSLFEGATRFKVSDVCTASAGVLSCPVALAYEDASGKSEWTDTVILTKSGTAWAVDDIVYGGTWDFANKGRLSELLEAIAAEMPPAP